MHEMHEQRGAALTLLTTKDVQDLIRVDRSTIYRMAEDGRIPAIKVGRQWRFPEDQINEWLKGRAVPTPGDAGGTADAEAAPASLPALLPPESIQALADLVGDLLGVMVILTDMDGRPLTEVANPCGMFRAVQGVPGAVERCIEGWREFGEDVDLSARFVPSHLGFLCSRGFVRVGSELKGMVIVGGIRPDAWPPPHEQIATIAADLGMDPDELAAHIDEVYDADTTQREWILAVLPRIGDLVSRLAQERGRLVSRLDAIATLAGGPDQRSTS
jgi:excisionase family DNA binding protein